jgi:hypothetical protein
MTKGGEVVAASRKVCAGLDADHIAACIDVTLLALIERCAGVAEETALSIGPNKYHAAAIAAAIRKLGEEKG